MRINTSAYQGSVYGQYMGAYNTEIQKSLSKLTSGLRVYQPSQSSGDYFQAQNLQRRANETKDVARTLETHVSRIQSAEGYLKEVQTMLDDMSELALKASQESNADIRTNYGKEYDKKVTALGKLLDGAVYEGESLLKGGLDSSAGGTARTAKLSENPAADGYAYDILDTRFTSATGLNMGSFATAETDWGNAGTGQTKAADYHTALTDADSGSTRLERNMNRLATHLTVLKGSKNALDVKASNYEAASGSLVNVDEAEESVRLSNLQIRRQMAMSFLAQNNVTSAQVYNLLAQGSMLK